MKIALLHDSVLPPKSYGGIERVIMSLVSEFQKRGHQVVVACRQGSSLPGVETVTLPPDYYELQPESYLPADVDFIHAHQPLKMKPRLPFLITIHGNGKPGETYFANTNFVSQSHAANHGAKYFVYNGVDPDHYPFNASKENYFVFLAKASWRVKNLKTCIAMANDLKMPLHVMGGEGRDSTYVRYHGLVGEAEKLPLLRNARALIYPTNWQEPFGIALIEALACGTPVIASSNGAMPEIVRRETGVICSSYKELLAAPGKLVETSAEDCRRDVEEKFSNAAMATGYLRLFEKILNVGELDQAPHYSFDPLRTRYLYKPTLANRLRLKLLGKI